jgi:hypothetical protein
MKLQFIKDGAVQGWVIALLITLNSLVLFNLGFIFKDVRDAWGTMGAAYVTWAGGMVAAWFAFKIAQKVTDKGGGGNETGNNSQRGVPG